MGDARGEEGDLPPPLERDLCPPPLVGVEGGGGASLEPSGSSSGSVLPGVPSRERVDPPLLGAVDDDVIAVVSLHPLGSVRDLSFTASESSRARRSTFLALTADCVLEVKLAVLSLPLLSTPPPPLPPPLAIVSLSLASEVE